MRFSVGPVLVFASLTLLAPSQGVSAELYRPDVVIVKLRPQSAKTAAAAKSAMATGLTSFDRLNNRYDIRDIRRSVPASGEGLAETDRYGVSRYYTIDLAPGADLQQALADYAADPHVEIAEPDYIMPLDMIPDDPDYGMQWTHFSALEKDIDTQEGWDLEVGDSTVIVGVIDSGIQHDHADLKASIWVNPYEDLDGDGVPWDADDMNGIDEISGLNGKVDDLIGYDFMPVQGGCLLGEDCNGPDNNPADFAGHGTHVNGIVGAITDNVTGVAGVAGGERGSRRPGVKLMGLRAGYVNSAGQGFVIMSACAEAVDYAVANGASVINCSWGSSGTLIRNSILNAVAAGVVVCKSAGNDTSDVPDIIDSTFGVLAVASLRSDGGKSEFSNYGTWVDISAPGSSIYNTFSNGGVATYATLSGTSMSSPTVAGVAALLKSHHPWFTKTQIDTLLMNYAEDVDADNPFFAGLLGSGRVNAYNSLAVLTTADFDVDTAFGRSSLLVNFTDNSPNAPNGPYQYDFGDGNLGAGPNASHNYTDPGLFTVKYTGSGPSGPHTRIRPNMIVVVEDTVEYGDTTIQVGQSRPVRVRLHNTHAMNDITLPFNMIGTPGVVLDSIVLTPLTANWNKQKVFDGSTAQAWRLRALTTGNPIPAGNGTVAYAWFRVTSGSGGQVETLDSATLGTSQYTLRLTSEFASFKPDFLPGSITLTAACNCFCHADPNCDAQIDVVDVVSCVNVAFRGASDQVDATCTHIGRSDVNCDCAVDVVDVVLMVNVAFRGSTTPFCNACTQPCTL